MIAIIRWGFIISGLLWTNIFPQQDFDIDQSVEDCLQSREVYESAVIFFNKDTAVVNIYHHSFKRSYLQSQLANDLIFSINLMDKLFDNSVLCLSDEEVYYKRCDTKNQLDCTISHFEKGKIEIAILYRCNGSIIRSVYLKGKKKLKLHSRRVYRY